MLINKLPLKRSLRSGFSLIELMVAVAIIGILATIALPSYQKFRARAVQTSAKSELAGIYAAEKSFKNLTDTYHAYLPIVGYTPLGIDPADPTGLALPSSNRPYGTTISMGVTLMAIPVSAGTLGFSAPAPYNAPGFPWTAWGASPRLCAASGPPINVAIYWFTTRMSLSNCSDVSHSTFCAISTGCPSQNLPFGNGVDLWYINQDRVLGNITF